MKFHRLIAVALGAGLWLAVLAAKQNDAQILRTGTPDGRREAVARILAIPPAERRPDVWSALGQEVDRLVSCYDVRHSHDLATWRCRR